MKLFVLPLLLLIPFHSFSQDTLTKNDLTSAEKMFGISFSEPDMDSLYDGVKETSTDIKKMHQYHLSNDVSMSLVQHPVLAGMKLNHKQLPVSWNLPETKLPLNKNDLAFYSLPQLAYLIKNKKITSVALTNFFIERLKRFGDTLHCVISITSEIALQEAAQADREIATGKYRGLLHGIPYGLKDLFAVKGTKTTWGAAPYKDQSIDDDAYVYTKLKDAGAVLVAKFTLGALAMGDYWYGGRTRNPWDLNSGSSGSSAGSTAATVAGLVPFAIGTETYGSIISPATTCGATGLRPTFGSVSRSGAMTLSWSLDKIGPLCRSAEDAAIVFYYLHGTDGKDAAAVNMPFTYTGRANLQKMKIAYAKNYFTKDDTLGNELTALNVFKAAGAQLIPVNFPDSGIYNFNMMGIIIGAECAAAFDEFTRTGVDRQMTRQGKYDWPTQFRAARFTPAVEYVNANRHRALLMKTVNDLLNKYDVVICPTWGGSQCAITNLTGNPAISIPTGFNSKHLPTSITLVGRLFDEATLLAVAKVYQNATSWNKMHPSMFK